jgi:DNA helicase HerA-like ATPase
MENNPALYIGKVEAVRGRSVEINVHKSKNSPHLIFNGKIIKGVSVGSYVKICKGFQELIGKVDEEFITENKLISQKDYKQEKERIKRILKLSLVGYFENGNFKQGVKELPLLDNEAFLLEEDEFNAVHNFIKKFSDENGEKKLDTALKIGVLSNEKGLPIKIGVNSLFASHIGIFGNTGSGKSYTLASLYHRLFEEYSGNDEFKKNAKFLLIDFNGEYSGEAILKDKHVCRLTTHKELDKITDSEKLPIGSKILEDLELLSIIADATEKTQKPFLKNVIKLYKKVYEKDSKVNYFKRILKNNFVKILTNSDKDKVNDILEYFFSILDESLSKNSKEIFISEVAWEGNYNQKSFYKIGRTKDGKPDKTQITKEEIETLETYKKINEYNFPSNKIDEFIHFSYTQVIQELLINKINDTHVAPVINRLRGESADLQKVINFKETKSIFADNKNFAVIDLNEVNQNIKKKIPLLISQIEYQNHKIDRKNNKEKYLNIIIDEAHNILSYDSKRESETWKDYRLETFEEIIKEGRKFGVFLTIASQRPSDISDTIISQLHNYFLHRLVNEKDILAIGRTVSYLDKISFESLPILPTGSCVLAGLSAQIPVIIDVDKIKEDFEPDNKTIIPTNYWGKPKI